MRQNKLGRLRKYQVVSRKNFQKVQDEGGDNEISTVEAEEKWSKRTREGHFNATFTGKHQQAPKKQLKINTMLSESSQRKRKKIEATVPNPAMTGSVKGRLKRKNGKKKRERKSVAMSKRIHVAEKRGQTESVSSSPPNYASLKNNANNCWFNATVQALAHGAFGDWLHATPGVSTMKGGCLPKLIAKLNETQQQIILDPFDSLSAFHKNNRTMLAGDRQDAHEGLVKLLDTIVTTDTQWTPQRALIENTRKCAQCQQVTDDLEEWTHFVGSVSIQGCLSVEDCILNMGPQGDENLTLYCNECKEDTIHHVWSTIVEEPQLLIIHLKRFNNSGKKLERKMKVTQEIDIAAVCSIQSGDNLCYNLVGAILHHCPTSISGHYTSLLKLRGRWLLFDDERISEVNDNNATAELERSGYLLFFERKTEVKPASSQRAACKYSPIEKGASEVPSETSTSGPPAGYSFTEAKNDDDICCLNQIMIDEVNKVAYNEADDTATLVNSSGKPVRNFSYEEIRRLIGKSGSTRELSNFVINGYLELLINDYNLFREEDACTEKCSLLTSNHFSELRRRVLEENTHLIDKVPYAEGIMDAGHVFVAVHLPGPPGHWCLLYIQRKKKRMVYLDPLGIGAQSEETFRVARCLTQVGHNKNGEDSDWNAWRLEKLTNKAILPVQETSTDCGVFVCMYALCIILGGAFQFSQANITTLRMQMAYEILEGRICFTNLARFEHTEPFCPQGDVVTAHPKESHQQGVKTQLRRRSKFKPTWVEYFMYLAFGASMRSKGPSTRVGCVIVDSQTLKILSIGYNGFPPGISNSAKNWEKKRKTDFVVHAEANAVLLKGTANLENSIAFVTLFPCKDCAQILIQAGVRRVYYLSFREKFRESVKIFKEAGVEFLRFKGRDNETLEPFRKSFITLLSAARGHVNTLLQPARENINTVIETARDDVNTLLQTPTENVNTLLQKARESVDSLLETAKGDIDNLFQTARDDVNTLLQTPTENVYTSLQTARNNVKSLLQTARERVNSKAGPNKNELYEWIKKEKEDLREKDIESPWVRDDQDEQGSDEFLFKKWTDYYLFLALVASTRSSRNDDKEGSTGSSEKDDKEGAILIDVETFKMCSMSYKGYPRGVKETSKKEMMVSAITNALALRFCEGNKFYAFCTSFPEEKEVPNLAQAKIERLYFLAPTNLSAKALSTLKDAGVEFVPMDLLDQTKIEEEVEKTIKGLVKGEEENEASNSVDWRDFSPSGRDYDLKPLTLCLAKNVKSHDWNVSKQRAWNVFLASAHVRGGRRSRYKRKKLFAKVVVYNGDQTKPKKTI